VTVINNLRFCGVDRCERPPQLRGLFCFRNLSTSWSGSLVFCLNLEMKAANMIVKMVSVNRMVVILILASCSTNNNVLTSSDIENVNSESVSDSYTSETSEMSMAVLSNVNDTQLGSAGLISDLGSVDSRLTGASITVSGAGGASNPQGKITVDFRSGTTDPNGVLRKGMITIAYTGRRWIAGSSYIISCSGYSRNNVVFDDNMTLTITNLSTDSTATTLNFHHVLAGCKLTFPDKTWMLRTADFNESVNSIAKTKTLSASGLTQTASGTTRAGQGYTMDIKSPLVYQANCLATKVYIPVGGEKSLIVGSTPYVINYGDGTTCDNTATVKAGDKSITITVNGDGN
jgi:hypothetical protein